MEPPPLPASARFRLRIEVLAHQDGRNVSADPLCKFTIVKNGALPLPDLTLRQLSHEVLKRFKSMYPSQPLFTIDKSQDSLGFDLHLEDRVKEVFADLDVLRVIQGATFRDSVEPHRARIASVQPNGFSTDGFLMGRKRSIDVSNIQLYSKPEKRQRTSNVEADRPIRSCERDLITDEDTTRQGAQHTTMIQDSQGNSAIHIQGHSSNEQIQIQSSLPVLEVPDSIQKVDGVYKDVQSLNAVTKAAAQLQHITSPLSADSSKSGALTSGSDARNGLGATTSLNRKLPFYDESNGVGRLNSASTPATTPPSAGLQHDTSTLVPGSRKLKRPSLDMASGRDGGKKVARGPRVDIHDEVETEPELPRLQTVRSTSGKASSKFKQPSPPTGVSKFKARKASSGGEGSPRQLRGSIDNGKDIGQQLEATRSRADSRRLDQERQEAENSTQRQAEEQSAACKKVAEEREAASKRLDLKEAKAKELEATVRRAAATKPKPESDGINARQKVEKEAQKKAIAASEARADTERKRRIRLEMEANRKREEDELQAQKLDEATKSKAEMQSVQSFFEISSIRPNGMLARAQEARESPTTRGFDSEARPSALKASGTSSKRASSTPFIPRGRLSAALLSSPAVGSASSREPTPRARVETPVPLPPSLGRKVSFAEPPSQSRSSQKSITPTSSLRQTTIVPPRLGITDVKSTPKRGMRSTSSGLDSSKSNKGKAKVIESPAKLQPTVIIISSDDESDLGRSGLPYINIGDSEYHEDDFRAVGEPGPAYRKPLRPSGTIIKTPSKSPMQTNRETIIKVERVSSPEDNTPSHPLRGRSGPRGLRSHATSYSPIRPPLASQTSCSPEPQEDSQSENASTVINDIIKSMTGNSNTRSKASQKDQQGEYEGSKRNEEQHSKNDSENDDESAETSESIAAATLDHNLIKTTQNRAQEETEEADNVESDETGDEESEVEDGMDGLENVDGVIQNAEVEVPPKNDIPLVGNEESADEMEIDEEMSGSDGDSESEEIDAKSPKQNHLAGTSSPAGVESGQNETSDEESDESSDAEAPHTLQIEVDKQLHSQAHQAISPQGKRMDKPIERAPIIDKSEQLRKLSETLPSLRRMKQEAERTKEADSFAARARGIAKAQKDDARQASESEETEGSTDLGSSASEDDQVDDDSEGKANTSSQAVADPRSSKNNRYPRRSILPPKKQPTVGFEKLAKKFSVTNKNKARG